MSGRPPACNRSGPKYGLRAISSVLVNYRSNKYSAVNRRMLPPVLQAPANSGAPAVHADADLSTPASLVFLSVVV